MGKSNLFRFVLTLCLFVSSGLAVNAFTVNGINYEVRDDDATAVNVASGSYSGSIVIPSSVTFSSTTYTVKGIANQAFKDCSSVTYVSIPSSVISVGTEAFNGCIGLVTLSLPNSVTALGDYAFANCSNLEYITLSNALSGVGVNAFIYCPKLKTVILNRTNVPSVYMDFYAGWGSADVNTDFSSCSLYVPTESIDEYASATGWHLFGNIRSVENFLDRGNAVTSNTAGATYSFSTSNTYEWEWDSASSRMRSTNYNVHSTTSQSTMYITTSKSTAFSFNYSISSESGCDVLRVLLDGTTIVSTSGSTSSSYSATLSTGSHTLVFKYVKDGSVNSGDDRAYLSNIRFQKIPITSIYLNSSSATLVIGNTKSLTTTVSPSTASNTSVSWSSSNTSVATVSSSGVVTAVHAGTATITCSANDGSGVRATCAIKVTGNLSGRSNVITTNTASASYSFTTSNTYEWEWDSSNSRLRSTNYNVHSTTSQTTMSMTFYQATKFSFNYAVSSESGYDKLTIILDGTTIVNAISGSSSSSYTANIASGSHTLTMQYSKDSSENSGNDRAYISNVKFEPVPVSSITLSSSSKTLVVGETSTLTAVAYPTNAANRNVTWRTSNSSVATVSGGVVTAVNAGSATITCSAADGKGAYSTCSVRVITRGDVDGDGSITAADITGDVKFITGDDTSGLYALAADYNRNGSVTTTDAIAIVRLALTGTTTIAETKSRVAGLSEASRALSVDDITMASNDTKEVSVKLADNLDKFTSVQFDVTLPDGISIENVTVGNRTVDHSVVSQVFEDGRVRVICYSLSNGLFTATEGDVVKLTLKSEGSASRGMYDVNFSDILLVRNNVSTVYTDKQSVTLNITDATDINTIADNGGINAQYKNGLLVLTANEEGDATVYATSGALIYKNHLTARQTIELNVPKGVYLVNGKKMLIK